MLHNSEYGAGNKVERNPLGLVGLLGIGPSAAAAGSRPTAGRARAQAGHSRPDR